MLIVPVAPTIAGIVIAAPEVHHVTFSDYGGSSFTFTGFHERCRIYTWNYHIFPTAVNIIFIFIFDHKIGFVKM